MKLRDIVIEYAKTEDIPLREAFDDFYKSILYVEVSTGISDMHCRSDGYLAEELRRERQRI
jgi:hypothetical protein